MERETKLTAVTLSRNGEKFQDFFHLPLNEKGQPILPANVMAKIHEKLGAKPGDTISIG